MSYRQCLRGFLKVCGSAVILGSIVLGSCAPQHKDSILFGTNTTAGLKVGVDERQVPIAILGYNRQEAALVPLFVYGDGMFKAADRNVEGTTYLQLAKERFEKAEAAGDKDPKRQALFDEGVRFVSMAYDTTLRKSANGAKVSEASPILERLNGLAGKPDLQNVTLCKLLAEAEIQRPSTAIQYLEEYKYIGDCDGQKYKDAYSVLGTFTGSAKGAATPTGSNALEATGSIAQYFATGVAAQNLSRTPASVSGNASAIKAATDAMREAQNRQGTAFEYMVDEPSFLEVRSAVGNWWSGLDAETRLRQINVITQWANEDGVSVDPLKVDGKVDPSRFPKLLDSLSYNQTNRRFLADIVRNARGMKWPL